MHLGVVTFGAMLASAASAEAQGSTVASTRVEASGQVRIVGDEPDRLLIAAGGLTFSLSMRGNGQLALAMAGASFPLPPQDAAASPGPEVSLTGSAQDRETVSLSVAGGDLLKTGPATIRETQLRVVIASFN